MLKTKTTCVPLLAFFLTSAISPAFAADSPAYDADPFALPDLGSPLQLAEAETENTGMKSSTSPKCLAFASDPDADLGEVLRAGCKPTLGQMSALMDNPLGNVAMLFNLCMAKCYSSGNRQLEQAAAMLFPSVAV
jgi:hypothetical protein